MTGAASSYHHGDLRNALIIAAAEIIEDSGSLSFSMADAARRAGVSTAAPYRHFRDKDALLDAVCELAFYGLGIGASSAIQSKPSGSIERIIALGYHYLNYVVGKPAFYDLMWGDMGTRAFEMGHADRKPWGFFILRDAVAAYLDHNDIDSSQALDISVHLWAMVHGMSGIMMSKKLEQVYPDCEVGPMLENAVHTFMAGLKAREAGESR